MTPFARLAAELAEGRRAALVTVLALEGSGPREPGARMVVTQAGISGTIGGGALEWEAIAEAGRLLEAPEGAGTIRRLALGPELGQCCGGRMDLLVEAFAPADLGWIAPLAAEEPRGPFATRGTRDARGIFRRAPTSRELAAPRLEGDVLLEPHGEARTPLLLFGAGHVGRAFMLALAPLPFMLEWIDPRPEAFPEVRPRHVRLARDPEAALAAAPGGALVYIMTHDHALDLALADQALARPDLPFVGVIGSATKAARFRARLAAAGHGAALGRFSCPIGAPDLGSKAPAIIAAGLAVDALRRRAALARPAARQNRVA